jgi:hypothetical protein
MSTSKPKYITYAGGWGIVTTIGGMDEVLTRPLSEAEKANLSWRYHVWLDDPFRLFATSDQAIRYAQKHCAHLNVVAVKLVTYTSHILKHAKEYCLITRGGKPVPMDEYTGPRHIPLQ